MRIYLAGPMTGIPQFNIPAFDAAAEDLRSRGYDVVSPAELDDPRIREIELHSHTGDLECLDRALAAANLGRGTWGEFLARDVKLIADGGIEAIVCLPGWEDSKGARLETFVGRLCGLPILEYVEGSHLHGALDLSVNAAHAWREGEGDSDGFVDLPHYSDVPDPQPAEHHYETPRVRAVTPPVERHYNTLGHPEEEVRVTDPNTGGQKGMKLAQIGALDPLAILEVGKVAGFGAQKYERFNFARGYAWSLSYDALQRHLHQWAAGEEADEESGLSHIAHAAWHCLALLTFTLRKRGTDDRLHTTLEAM